MRVVPGYRSPLDALSRDEAGNALLILGVPEVIRELGLEGPLTAAEARVESRRRRGDVTDVSVVHLDLPRWFQVVRTSVPGAVGAARPGSASREDRVSATARVQGQSTVDRAARAREQSRRLVRRRRYLEGQRCLPGQPGPFRQADGRIVPPSRRIQADRVLGCLVGGVRDEPSQLDVSLRASPHAIAIFPEMFGEAVRWCHRGGRTSRADGWRRVMLTFEHVAAAVHRLSGFGDLVEVLEPPEVPREDPHRARDERSTSTASPADRPSPCRTASDDRVSEGQRWPDAARRCHHGRPASGRSVVRPQTGGRRRHAHHRASCTPLAALQRLARPRARTGSPDRHRPGPRAARSARRAGARASSARSGHSRPHRPRRRATRVGRAGDPRSRGGLADRDVRLHLGFRPLRREGDRSLPTRRL